MIKLGLCYPLTDVWNYTHFTFSNLNVVLNAQKHFYDKGIAHEIHVLMPNYPRSIDKVRNDLVKQALSAGCTHLLFMDTDQIYTDADVVARLLEHDKDCVGCVVHRRYPPFDPCVFAGRIGKLMMVGDDKLWGVPLQRVFAIGFGCVMIKAEVFAVMPEPWFKIYEKDEGGAVGEDIDFCSKLHEYGFDVWVDSTVNIKHLSTVAIDKGYYRLWQKILPKTNGAKGAKR